MLEIKTLYEIQYLIDNQIMQRSFIISSSQKELEDYAQKNKIQIVHIKTIASNIGDPGAKGNDVANLIDLSEKHSY